MKLKNIRIGTLRLPAEFETAIVLIKEDLKNTKLMQSLNELGFDDSHYCTDLGSLVLAFTGFTHRTDELYNFYYNLIDQHAKRLEKNAPVPFNVALDVYVELVRRRG